MFTCYFSSRTLLTTLLLEWHPWTLNRCLGAGDRIYMYIIVVVVFSISSVFIFPPNIIVDGMGCGLHSWYCVLALKERGFSPINCPLIKDG